MARLTSISCLAVVLLSFAAVGADAGLTRNTFAAVMLGAKSTPTPISSPGVGALTVTIDRTAKTGVYKFLLAKLTAYKFSHIHLGNATTNGPIILWLDPPTAGEAKAVVPADVGAKFVSGAFSAANFTKDIAGWDAFVAALDAGNLYGNSHTVAHPSGEIRGQLM